MSSAFFAWVDLLAAAAWPARAGALAVVASPRLHTLPLLEQQGTVAWLHATPWADFTALPQQMPVPRPRYSLQDPTQGAADLLRRADLVLMEVADQLPDPLAAWWRQGGPQAATGLIYGPAQAMAWGHEALQAALHTWRPLPAPAGWRALAHPELLAGRARLSARLPALDRAWAQHLFGHLGQRSGAVLDAPLVPERARLRLRPPPITCVATLSEAMQHHISARGQALFGPRGGCSVLLPWGVPMAARFLVRHTTRWAYDITAALGPHQLQPLAVQSIPQGLVMDFELPAPDPGSDALLHLSLPRAAVPQKDFCELAAVEFTVELAG